jgi:hypothetical protein
MTNQLSSSFQELKDFMHNKVIFYRSVKIWNELREEAKLKFDQATINRLDASGYITNWMKRK